MATANQGANDTDPVRTYSFEMTDARVVAILDEGGGAVVEEGLSLTLTEGRLATIPSRDGGFDRDEYNFGFMVTGGDDPEASEAVEARIVLTGTDDAGRLLDIRGHGWIGYDNHGAIDGFFEDPPTILIHRKGTGDRPSDLDRLWSGHPPQPSAEYLRASRGRTSEEDDH